MPRLAQTIPIGTTLGKLDFSISDADWIRIEGAYGHPLSASVRQHILGVTTSFVNLEPFERGAEKLSIAQERAHAIQKATKKFAEALAGSPDSSASFYADHLIGKHFADPRLSDGDQLRHLRCVLTSLSAACISAVDEMGAPNLPGYRPGEFWDSWIRNLTKILQADGLPVENSKGFDNKTKTDTPPSPFTLFVKELQSCIPPAARRHTHSIGALAGGIYSARAVARDAKSP
jgi:hypothetical protein